MGWYLVRLIIAVSEPGDEVEEIHLVVGSSTAVLRDLVLVVERERRSPVEFPLQAGDVVAGIRVGIDVRLDVVSAEHDRDGPVRRAVDEGQRPNGGVEGDHPRRSLDRRGY